MSDNATPPAQSTPRFRTDIYPFIYPSKFRGSLEGKVAIITGLCLLYFGCHPFPNAIIIPSLPLFLLN
jgi:hypothetical protein